MTDSEIEARIAAVMQAIHDRYDARFRVLLIVTVCGALLNASINVWRASHAVPSLLPSSNSQSVTVGATGATQPPAPPRDLTVEEFARLLKRDERTVISYIAAERVDPPPRRDPGTRSWLIAPYSVLLPKSAADSGNERLSAADSR